MERDDGCGQFVVAPPRQHGQFMAHHHQLMEVAGDNDYYAAGVAAGSGGGERIGKRRFTEEQVRSLETTFHARRAKLEPKEKAELARELGLQPRQVAIWFQNKRARWRSKQLQHDYAALRAQYDALRDRVEALKHEKLALAAQVDELKGRLAVDGDRRQEQQQQQSGSCEVNGGAADGDGRNNNNSGASCVAEDDGVVTPPAADASEESVAAAAGAGYCYDDYDDHAVYGVGGGGLLPEPFCITPELWDTWPMLEWNAVA